MAIKTIFWDIGGVLERTEDFIPREKIAQRFGWSVSDLGNLIFGKQDEYRIQLGLIGMEEHFANIARALEISPTEASEVFAGFFEGDQLDYELADFIRTLKGDYTTAVISNYSDALRERIEDLWQIGDAFDQLIISAEIGIMKPAPEIYQIALERTGTQPEEGIFIDDFIENVHGAQRVGMKAIHFETPGQARDDLMAMLNSI